MRGGGGWAGRSVAAGQRQVDDAAMSARQPPAGTVPTTHAAAHACHGSHWQTGTSTHDPPAHPPSPPRGQLPPPPPPAAPPPQPPPPRWPVPQQLLGPRQPPLHAPAPRSARLAGARARQWRGRRARRPCVLAHPSSGAAAPVLAPAGGCVVGGRAGERVGTRCMGGRAGERVGTAPGMISTQHTAAMRRQEAGAARACAARSSCFACARLALVAEASCRAWAAAACTDKRQRAAGIDAGLGLGPCATHQALVTALLLASHKPHSNAA